jgi:hypothetical protein
VAMSGRTELAAGATPHLVRHTLGVVVLRTSVVGASARESLLLVGAVAVVGLAMTLIAASRVAPGLVRGIPSVDAGRTRIVGLTGLALDVRGALPA